jgi:hypothetical protein
LIIKTSSKEKITERHDATFQQVSIGDQPLGPLSHLKFDPFHLKFADSYQKKRKLLRLDKSLTIPLSTATHSNLFSVSSYLAGRITSYTKTEYEYSKREQNTGNDLFPSVIAPQMLHQPPAKCTQTVQSLFSSLNSDHQSPKFLFQHCKIVLRHLQIVQQPQLDQSSFKSIHGAQL